MIPKLTPEQRDALRKSDGALEVEDDETRKSFVIIELDLHQRAMQALEERDARRAIQKGIEELEAGIRHGSQKPLSREDIDKSYGPITVRSTGFPDNSHLDCPSLGSR
jgi:hypothetical protein